MHVKFTSGGNTLMQERWLMKRIEHAHMIRQILNLASFLPDQVLSLQWKELDKTFCYVAVVLTIKICNFAELTEKYNKVGEGGLYRLTATLNAYLGGLVETINFFKGDVFKFAGDKFVAQWNVKPHECLMEILHQVVCCALYLQKMYGEFVTEANLCLKIKMCISCGNTSFLIVGERRKYYTVVGDVMTEVTATLRKCAFGEVAIPEGTWVHMPCDRYEYTVTGQVVKVTSLAYKATERYAQIQQDYHQDKLINLINLHLEYRNWLHTDKKFKTHQTDIQKKTDFIRSVSARVWLQQAPKNWRIEELRKFVVRPVYEQIYEGQPVEYLTQLVEVSMQVIRVTPTSLNTAAAATVLKDTFTYICDICERAGIITMLQAACESILVETVFGLKGYSKDGGHRHALMTGYEIKRALVADKNIKSVSVAVINTLVYSGVIGHPVRKEYTIISMGVRMAYRLAEQYKSKVVCDYKTFKQSKLASFLFKRIECEIQAELLLEYNEAWEKPPDELRHRHQMLGRGSEFQAIFKTINNREENDYFGICFGGSYNIGKTAILENSIYKLTKRNVCGITVAAIELMPPTKRIPYFCVSKIYHQLYDMITSLKSPTANFLVNLPNELFDARIEIQDNNDEDLAMQKYRILNYFRDITNFVKNIVVIFIDNAEQIDLQSWEILDITLMDKNIRLIMAGSFEAHEFWELRYNFTLNEYIKYIELSPIDNKYIAAMSCQFLEVSGIPKKLTLLLINSCEGRPGFLQLCLLRLVNNGSIELKLISRRDMDEKNVYYPKSQMGAVNDVITVASFEKYEALNELTLEVISTDLFNSFSPFEQLVIKTGSVLGSHFTRNLLIIALKYPSEKMLSKAIVRLFSEEVFECGARYIYGNSIETNSLCCKCTFETSYFDPVYERFYPKYAYCKILHFKDNGLREVAYNQIPNQQRIELHLLCTDVLENMNHKCPSCLRNPLTNVFDVGKFRKIIKYCTSISKVYKSINVQSDITATDIKLRIREIVQREKKIEDKAMVFPPVNRDVYDPKYCSCYEILLRVYTDLIYHSTSAGNLCKKVFFTMQFGCLLLILHDVASAITYLNDARELCYTLPTDKEEKSAMEIFRKMQIGKISVNLAKAFMTLGQLKTTKNHLAIAVRQYNIPSLALSYKYYKQFITRSYLINRWRTQPTHYRDVIGRCDMGSCLSLCSKLFFLEGNLKMAKMTAAYSIYLIKSTNPNVNLLFESYCTATDIYGRSNNSMICEKITGSITKDIMDRYSTNYLYNIYYINSMLNALFLQQYVSGNIIKAIRFGYRSVDLSLSFFSTQRHFQIFGRMTLLLIYNFRIGEAAYFCEKIREFAIHRRKRKLLYNLYILQIYLHTNFLIRSVRSVTKYAKYYLNHQPSALSLDDYHFIALVRLHYLRAKSYEDAENFNWEFSFNADNVRQESIYKMLLVTVECNLYSYMFNKKNNSASKADKKHVKRLVRLMNGMTGVFKLFVPIVMCLNAWWHMIRRWKVLAYFCLNRAEKVANRQGNVLIGCFVRQLRKHWKAGSGVAEYRAAENDYKKAVTFTLDELVAFLCPFPLSL